MRRGKRSRERERRRITKERESWFQERVKQQALPRTESWTTKLLVDDLREPLEMYSNSVTVDAGERKHRYWARVGEGGG